MKQERTRFERALPLRVVQISSLVRGLGDSCAVVAVVGGDDVDAAGLRGGLSGLRRVRADVESQSGHSSAGSSAALLVGVLRASQAHREGGAR